VVTVILSAASVLALASGTSAFVLILIQAPLYGLMGYWLAMGGWRRTVWGRPGPDALVPAAGPLLSERRARLYITMAVLAVVACGLALAAQIVQAE